MSTKENNEVKKMEIKILGPGCARCKATSEALEKVIQSRGIQAQLTKVEDMREIVSYGVLSTPGVVIDDPTRTADERIGRVGLTADESQLDRLLDELRRTRLIDADGLTDLAH